MDKKFTIGVIAVLLIAIIAGGTYFILKGDKNDAPTKTKEPETTVQVGDGSKGENEKSLVVFFSVPETDDPNKKMTTEEENSAIVVDGKVLGNTEYAAELIKEYMGADIYRIEPKTPYTTKHSDLVSIAQEEQRKDARPEIKSKISNFDDYDTIYVGYPIWWSDLPQILYTFFELYDFEGKTVIPFSTHGGSGLAGTVNTIKNKLDGANVITDAFTISRNDMEDAPEEIEAWLKKIDRID